MIVFNSIELSSTQTLLKTITVSATAKSISVSNYSHFFLNVHNPFGNGFGELPPFTTQSFVVQPGQQIEFSTETTTIPAQPQTNENVSYTESSYPLATGLQSLSIPVYSQTVIADRLKQDPKSGFYPYQAGGTTITFANEVSYIELINMDTQKRIVYFNFNQPATGSNADLRLLPDPNGQGQGAYRAVPADYQTIYLFGGDVEVTGWYKG